MITRRTLLAGATALAAGAESPPEATRLRLIKTPALCWAPQYVAEELLRAEGFTDVRYVDIPVGVPVSKVVSAGEDLSMNFVGPNLVRVDQGAPVVFLAGVHVGCVEVFGDERLRRISDLKGKTLSVSTIGGTDYIFFSAIAAYVGLDPQKDVNWAVHEPDEGLRLFVGGKVSRR